MKVTPLDRVIVRVPNWRKANGGWVESPTEHEVVVTAVREGSIDFRNWWGAGESSLPIKQVVRQVTP